MIKRLIVWIAVLAVPLAAQSGAAKAQGVSLTPAPDIRADRP